MAKSRHLGMDLAIAWGGPIGRARHTLQDETWDMAWWHGTCYARGRAGARGHVRAGNGASGRRGGCYGMAVAWAGGMVPVGAGGVLAPRMPCNQNYKIFCIVGLTWAESGPTFLLVTGQPDIRRKVGSLTIK